METVKDKQNMKDTKQACKVINVLTPYFEYKNKKGNTIKYII